MTSLRAYGPNLALADGARVRASSGDGALRIALHPTGYRLEPRDGWTVPFVRPIGCWLWQESSPAWLEIGWDRPQRFDEVVLHLPVLLLLSRAQRAVGEVAVEYWNADADRWQLLGPVIAGWTAPTLADGSQTRALRFDPVTTARVRIRVERGNCEGWSFLERVEVYATRPAAAPLSLRSSGPTVGLVLRPGDRHLVQVSVTDADGHAVLDCPVGVAGQGVARTDRTGRAGVPVESGHAVGRARFTVTGGTDLATVVELETQGVDAALSSALAWLEETATRLERGSRMPAYDGTVMYTPDGVASYAGFWVRDFQYMVEGHPDGIPDDDVRDGFRYLIGRQREDGAMPNKVRVDGVPVYCPGAGCDGTFGPNPPPDNPQFMVKLAYHYAQRTGDLSLVEEFRQQLVAGLEFLPRSPANSLVHITPTRPSSPYGFTDAVAKTGDQLFDSLLLWEAATGLAELLLVLADEAEAYRWTAEAARIAADLQTLYDDSTGMFHAASVDCHQVDIWGSAFAAYLGVVSDEQKHHIGGYLVANYGEVVNRGQVRHTAPGEYWQRTIVPNRDVYQDGAYWAIPAGWVATAIDHVDQGLSRRMLLDLVRDFQENGVNEAINPCMGYVAVPNYVASATTMLPALRTLARRDRAPRR